MTSKMKILQINSSVNSGSTGRIAEQIGSQIIKKGHESFIAYGRGNRPSSSKLIKIGNFKDVLIHGIYSLFFDKHGFGSIQSTKKLLKQIDEIKPDVIGLHNVHGYYLNIELLFNYIKLKNIPLVWTFHDCWPITGHCAYFDSISCEKWKTGCTNCELKNKYPKSILIDNSRHNYLKKKSLFNQVSHVTIVTPSIWLKNIIKDSFLKHAVVHIPNGVDLNVFKPVIDLKEIKDKYNIGSKKVVLGVASVWDERKGLNDFIKLKLVSDRDIKIILVGLNKAQIKNLPANIIGIERTESITELAALYSLADVFVNPTYVDNFPTTNIESLACGTPIITYKTGGSPEAIDKFTGVIVEKGNLSSLENAISHVLTLGKEYYSKACRERAEKFYDKDDKYDDYFNLYETILKGNK
jgi:putative colanic acid biosynthesis glycosyltransferase